MILTDCERCFVYAPNGQMACSGRVSVVGENIFLYFQDIRGFQDAHIRTQVEFFDSSAGIVRADCELLIQENRHYRDMVEPWMARCRIQKIGKIVQRQKDPRVRTNVELACVSLKHGPFVASLRNISAGGIYILTDQRMEKGDAFLFTHSFLEDRLRLEASVLWSKKLSDREAGYGCRFVGLSESDQREIGRYVAQRQAKQRS